MIDPERHGVRIRQLEAEERQLKAELAAPEAAEVVARHSRALARDKAQLERLETALAQIPETMDSLRELIARVTVAADYTIEIEGRLSALIGQPVYPTARVGDCW